MSINIPRRPRGRWLHRLLGSWLALIAVIGAGVGALAVAAVVMESRLQRSSLVDIQARGRVLGAVVTEGEFTTAELGGSIPPDAQYRMRIRIDRLRAHNELLGLQIWSRSNRLLFAHPDFGAAELSSRAAELSSRAVGVKVGRSYGGVRTDDVLTALDLDRDRTPDVTLVTIFPASEAAALGARYQRGLAIGGGVLLTVVIGLLVTARRRMLRREHEALHDPLTGLGNRLYLAEAARRCGSSHYGLLLMDLDGFKDINDTLGHAAGDELLIQVAHAVRRAVRRADHVGRLGGDEFAILLPDVADPQAALTVAHEVRRQLARAGFGVRGIAINVDASVGVAAASGAETDIDELLRQADVAMYRAKASRAGVMMYNAADDHHDTDRLAMLGELRHGIDHDQLVLHYQPLVTAQTPADGEPIAPAAHVASVEALVRWQHPTRGLLGPGVFIPVVEHTGLIHDLTSWVLNRAVSQAATWRRMGLDLTVAVNLSPRAITGDILNQVLTVLDVHGLPSDRLKLEITETAIVDNPTETISILRSLRTAGVKISLDDFGAGYTSLAYLTSLPLTELKIDKSFIDQVTASTDKCAVVTSVVHLAHSLGLSVVAEGVETEAISARVSQLGCDSIQGYFYSRPLAPEELETWLALRQPALPVPRRG